MSKNNTTDKDTMSILVTKDQLEMLISGLECDLEEGTFKGYTDDRKNNNDRNERGVRNLVGYLEACLFAFEHKQAMKDKEVEIGEE